MLKNHISFWECIFTLRNEPKLRREFSMKNKSNVPLVHLFGNLNRARSAKVPLLIIALVAVIVFSMVACGSDGDSGGGGGGGGSGGTFTLTGIPSQYNGKYALFTGTDGSDDYMLYGGQSLNAAAGTGTLSPISNGSVSLSIWKVDESRNAVRYSGNSTTGSGYVAIFNAQTYSASSPGEQIAIIDFDGFFTFSNGSATRTWSQGTVSNGNL
jgi:hypothetical protein